MSRIAKVYSTIFKDPNVIEASDTRRAFDDAYDLINGGLDLTNLISGLSLGISNVGPNSADFSATTYDRALEDIRNQNFHSLHFWAHNSGISVFPGSVFVRGIYATVASRIELTPSDNFYVTGNFTNTQYVLLVNSTASITAITASDFRVTLLTNITPSLAWDDDLQGYYPAIASGIRRALHVFANDESASTNPDLYDQQVLDSPQKVHVYTLTNQEASGAGFLTIDVTQTTGFAIKTVNRIFDYKDNRYSYLVGGILPATSGVSHSFNSGGLIPDNAWRISYFNAKGALGSFGGRGGVLFNSATQIAAFFCMNSLNVIHISISSGDLGTASFSMKLERIFSDGRHGVFRE